MRHSVSLRPRGAGSQCACGQTFEGREHNQYAYEHAMAEAAVDKQCPDPKCGHWESSHDMQPSNDRLDDGVSICYECQAPCAMDGS